jgi:dihydroflavonol-4-reductase
MKSVQLVIGANGHLGRNLVMKLLERGANVRASVRQPGEWTVAGMQPCKAVFADLLDPGSLVLAMEDAEVVYMTASVYKYWARNPEKEIVEVNVEGVRNVMQAAAKRKIRRIVYVGTALALNCTKVPLEETGWYDDRSEPYQYSKAEAEKLVFRLAEASGIEAVSVLPTAMCGPNFVTLTPTMETMEKVLRNRLPFDPGFNMNCVDVRDIAEAMIAAAATGRDGERYLLGQEQPVSMTDIFRLAHEMNPSTRIPRQAPYGLTYTLAAAMEFAAGLLGKQPLMQRKQVKAFYKADMRCNIEKAKQDLGYNPRPTEAVIRDALQALIERKGRLAEGGSAT